MRRVLVTGAGGFVGAHVVAPLAAAGFEVVAAGRHPIEAADVRFEAVDFLDQDARRALVARLRPTHLLHLAWIAEPGVYWQSAANLDWVSATLDLFRAFREAGGSRAVGVGTCAEYAWGAPRFKEDDTLCEPATLYGAAKDATRRLLEVFGRQHAFSFAWARLFFLYGPGEARGRLVSDAIGSLRDGAPLPTSKGEQRRDFLHVTDAAAALTALLASEVTGAVNIASGDAVPVREILGTIAQLLGNGHLIRYGERPLSPTEPAVIEGDITRLASEVGFRPHFDLVSGLRDTVERTGRVGAAA